jgi:hypothetical protein
MTQNFDVFAKRKGQSAIEYLMTYGWMLLVVAIVGGAIFATVQGQCTSSTSGFSTADVRIDDFAQTADRDMAFELRNAAADPIKVTNISVANSGSLGDSVDISVGASNTATVSGLDVSSVDGCNDFDLTIEYDVDGGITDQQVTGTLTDSLSITAN